MVGLGLFQAYCSPLSTSTLRFGVGDLNISCNIPSYFEGLKHRHDENKGMNTFDN
jgi:hypothetical protein